MWGTVLVLALLTAHDPARLGIAAVLITCPRPLHNLLGYWLGGMAAGIFTGLGVLILSHHSLPIILDDVRSTVARLTDGYVQISIGMLALLIAALVAAGFPARQHAEVPVHVATPSDPVVQATTLTAFSRLTTRVHQMLKDGGLWVAFVAGLGSAIPPVQYLVALTAIVSSGAAVDAQLGAVVMFTVVVLTLVEVPLVSYLAMPAKAQAAMMQLQNWLRAYRRRMLVVILAVAGVLLVTAGIGSV